MKAEETDLAREEKEKARSSLRPDSIAQHHVEAFIEPFPEDRSLAVHEETVKAEEADSVREDKEKAEEGTEEDLAVSDDIPLSDENMQLRPPSGSAESFEEGDESTITLRSRSESSGSFSSSNGSAQVDWDELEKEEVQAPRDEGSDEVDTLI